MSFGGTMKSCQPSKQHAFFIIFLFSLFIFLGYFRWIQFGYEIRDEHEVNERKSRSGYNRKEKMISEVSASGNMNMTENNTTTFTDSLSSMASGSSRTPNETKLIIFWSRRPEGDYLQPYDQVQEGFVEFTKCEWSNCRMSRDRSLWREAAVIFYRPYDPFPDWPETRLHNQIYVHMLSDRPFQMHWWLAKFDDRINLTLNYRHDADIPVYKVAKEKPKPVEGQYVPRIPWTNKKRSVVWAVSHCKTASKREEYVAELSKYIDVDIYGDCGSLKCSKEEQRKCSDEWERKYKFYLAFENSFCRDYITEKFYRTLRLELIPVVLGRGNYSSIAPPHSYIDVRDHPTPKHLASYLHRLAENQTMYYEYFQWKQRYDMKSNINRICKLCEVAHNIKQWSRPARHDYYFWWMRGCYDKVLDQMRKKGQW